uniref:Uncharacterized protein n=1 Tax=virus sp. ctBM815 TaxID=2825806 RepID=A0A8S5RKV2_9VIRU|nr:MAG TPA: hypothetical protein [virus sp. ctBM815]DAV23883.1 MAG TPA: hypothetical protein [Bacteriophage sp.]
MKRLFEKLSMCLIMLIVAATVSSCDYVKQTKSEIRHDDSLMVTNMMREIDNPTFTDYSDAIEFQRSEGQWRHQDSVFFSIPEKVMRDVVSVLEKSGKPVTKMSISNEFEMNKHVYMNLPDKPDLYQAITPPDVPNTEVVDTIINGKHVQVIQSSSTNIMPKED